MKFRNACLIPVILAFCVSTKASDEEIVQRWLESNAGTKTLKVDFVQSRTLRAIKNPMIQEGTLWLDYQSNQFRWQLGTPAKTIVVSRGDKVAVMRTPMKRVEFRDSDGDSGSSSGMSGLTKGFPKTLAEFESRYRILSVNEKGNAFEIVTQPLGDEGEGVSRFKFIVDSTRFLLKGMILDLADGSEITTTFQRVERNPSINTAVFNPDMTGYRETRFRQG